jgi:hypothetical protein
MCLVDTETVADQRLSRRLFLEDGDDDLLPVEDLAEPEADDCTGGCWTEAVLGRRQTSEGFRTQIALTVTAPRAVQVGGLLYAEKIARIH